MVVGSVDGGRETPVVVQDGGLTNEDMGVPPTPPRAIQNIVIDANSVASGGDSGSVDFPFAGDDGSNTSVVCMFEEEQGKDNEPDSDSSTSADHEEDTPTHDEISKMLVVDLKEALSKRGIPVGGRKKDLVERLKQAVSSNIPVSSGETRDDNEDHAGLGFHPAAKWKLLDPSEDEHVPPLVYSHNLHPPGAPEGEPSVPLHNYTKYGVDHPPYIMEVITPQRDENRGLVRCTDTGNFIYETQNITQTVPNIAFCQSHHLDENSSPCDWFNSFLPVLKKHRSPTTQVTIEQITTWTNQRGYLSNAGEGGGNYVNWKPFSVEEMMSHLGVYLLNGLSPSPLIEYKFSPQVQDQVNGNDLCARIFGANSIRRHREFKAFFTACDPLVQPPDKISHPYWKVQPVLKQALTVSKEAIILGQKISVDEQTIRMQGRHHQKLCINYKKAGDGFQCDALCSDGYTFTFYFRNQPPPGRFVSGENLSPLHARVMSLFAQLNSKHNICTMDNLYMSAKFIR